MLTQKLLPCLFASVDYSCYAVQSHTSSAEVASTLLGKVLASTCTRLQHTVRYLVLLVVLSAMPLTDLCSYA
jgi:hypothetical protein